MKKSFLLDDLKRIADGQVAFFGRNCEVIIHDLSTLECSVVYVAGAVTRRQFGAPATNLLVRLLAQYGDAVPDMYSYPTQGPDGRPLKSSTTFIRNEKGKAVFALCMNYDVTGYINAISLIEDHIRIEKKPDDEVVKEIFSSNINETCEEITHISLNEFGKQPIDLSREERIMFIDVLTKNGTFLIKGMVEHVAGLMNISKYTLYGYRRICEERNRGKG